MALPGGEMMPREIKFRGMDLKGNWYYGNVSVLPDKVHDVAAGTYISNIAGCPFAYAVRPETVGEFIGLPDKNKKEIYDGDILVYQNAYVKIIFLIYWDEIYAEYETKSIVNPKHSDAHCFKPHWNTYARVIGNKWENKDLLNKGGEKV